jgi:hypothetical protein
MNKFHLSVATGPWSLKEAWIDYNVIVKLVKYKVN